MRWLRAGIPLLFSGLCLAADSAPLPAQSPCAAPAAAQSACTAPVAPVVVPSLKDLKSAQHAFKRGLKLEKSQNFDRAFDEFEQAARLVPMSSEYVAAREMTREHLAGVHLERGNDELLAGRRADALADFRAALEIDSQNEFAQQRLQDVLGPPPHTNASGPAQVVEKSDHLTTNPLPGLGGLHDIHYRGDSRGLLEAVASSYGLTIVFDDSFPSRRVRLDLDQVDFATALRAASQVTNSFTVAVEPTVLFAALDSADNHRAFDHMGLRSFYVPGATSPSDLNEVMNALRSLFEFKFVSLNSASSIITVRGPIVALEAATRFMSQLGAPQPEVLLDIQVLEINHTYASNIGLHVPNTFKLYNISAAALLAAGGANLGSLVNQLISSGGINQAGNSTIAALLAQLQGQGNSIFSQPLATFGGGLTLMGLSLDQISAVLSLNESSARTLQHVELRASQSKEATFKLGERFPVLNASFSPIASSPAIAGVLKNQTYTPPFPSVNYEDLGLTLKAKPTVHRNSDVGLEVSVQFRALGGGTINSVPIINNREYTGGVLLKDGEPAAIAGIVTTSDQRSLSGLPTFAQIPGFGVLASQHSHMESDDELLILITPHVVLESGQLDPPAIWLNK
jgi:general secretion pathway protein D